MPHARSAISIPAVAEVWVQLLGLERVSIDDNFGVQITEIL